MKPLHEFTSATYHDFLDFLVVDREGKEVGTLFSAWSDQETGAFEYLGIKTGFLMGKNHIVPAGGAQVDEDGHSIHVPYALEFLKDAPVCDAAAEITEEHEKEIKAYYTKNG